jgi:hypothetical protein
VQGDKQQGTAFIMSKRITRLGWTIAACILAAAAVTPTAVLAKPDKPENAAQTASGKGCLVRDGNGAYSYDANCDWHTVIKRDKNGAIQNFSYQDKGQLPAAAPRPKGAAINYAPWPGCPEGIKEVTTPSGQYSSDCKYGN